MSLVAQMEMSSYKPNVSQLSRITALLVGIPSGILSRALTILPPDWHWTPMHTQHGTSYKVDLLTQNV
jgi:hypothetical protein